MAGVLFQQHSLGMGERAWHSHEEPEFQMPFQNVFQGTESVSQHQVVDDAVYMLVGLHHSRFFIGVMHDHGFRHIADFVSEGAQSPAQVHILPVHEDPLVKTTQPLIDLASYGEGGAAAPLCFLCHRVVDLGMFVGELSQFPHRRIFIRLFYCFHKF